jgi:tripartite-type tricarboxylate transporter receptor subunit TctC
MKRAVCLIAGSLLVTVGHIEAAEKEKPYPNRPVRIIVPFAPGGPSDILSRYVGQKLGEQLGETMVIDNRGSVGGIIGAELGAKAPPDGYTLLLTANSLLTINPHVYKKLPYNPERELQPITQLTEGGNVVVVHPSVAAKTIKEFIALAKAKPGAINYATTGTGNVLGIANFRSMAGGIDMVPIAYKGTGQAQVALIAGEVQFFFMNPLVAVPHVKSGKLRALGVTSLTRNPALPDIAPVAETVPGFQNITWHSVQVPAGTPASIVKRLNDDLVKVVNQSDVQTRFKELGLTPVGNKPEDVRKLARAESQEVAKLVKQIGLEPQ